MTHAEYEYENQEELKTEYNEKTLHYLNLEALIATAANNKEFFKFLPLLSEQTRSEL